MALPVKAGLQVVAVLTYMCESTGTKAVRSGEERYRLEHQDRLRSLHHLPYHPPGG